ncbi:MAG: 23S rRNA (adenine(2503)-C(2))-methyltransferase RlmN [Paludibacteraceae bacterium]|nr:23S rRNA (adenine(2503)-C(2))-methyltransferase RlmN [Paludibacteraceae bacterium]
MIPLLGHNLTQLQQIARETGLPGFSGRQLAEWLYVKRVTDIDQMTNISKSGRERLKQQYEVGRHAPERVAISVDGTRKYLFRVSCGELVEAVYIPEEDRATLCVSTQAGCKMGCRFCMTGTLGFHGQLTAADILNQIFSIPESSRLTNLVYMGMGEPMDNVDNVIASLQVLTQVWGCAWSPKRITVSTVGLLPGLKAFIEQTDCHLAVSLHHPDPVGRESIMPVQRAYDIRDVIDLIARYDFTHQRRVSFEYIVFEGLNDTRRHLTQLVRMLRPLSCRINLIRFHGTAGNGMLRGVSDERMEQVRDFLTANGITTTIRRSRGEDIWAACGMLVAQQNQNT